MGDKRTTGLTGKYRVQRLDGKPVKWAFVLQDTDPFTPHALLAYARACERDYPALADDLTSKAQALRKAAEGVESLCPNPLHNDPLPTSFMAASEEAERRLEEGWDNLRCPDCGTFGWVRGEA